MNSHQNTQKCNKDKFSFFTDFIDWKGKIWWYLSSADLSILFPAQRLNDHL